jgi:hypothetical protein
MKPRTDLLECPAKPGYVTVQLPRGPHAFRLPTWSEAKRIAEYTRTRPGWVERTVQHEGQELTIPLPPESVEAEYCALVVGASWHHETHDLEAAYPTDDPSPANLVRYARDVERELEEAGYHHTEVATLAGALLDAMRQRQARRAAVTKEAETLAGFSGPRPDSTSSP